uniref:Uncharacterized protein n=1 Tax=Oryza brachyantha TaxID=4533 RepID=J3LDR4_ORYBR
MAPAAALGGGGRGKESSCPRAWQSGGLRLDDTWDPQDASKLEEGSPYFLSSSSSFKRPRENDDDSCDARKKRSCTCTRPRRKQQQQRQHLYLALDDWDSGYSIHRLDDGDILDQEQEPAAPAAAVRRLRRLPEPAAVRIA